VQKHFEGYGTFYGSVRSYNKDAGLWLVAYEDGDTEEYDEQELRPILYNAKPNASGGVPIVQQNWTVDDPRIRLPGWTWKYQAHDYVDSSVLLFDTEEDTFSAASQQITEKVSKKRKLPGQPECHKTPYMCFSEVCTPLLIRDTAGVDVPPIWLNLELGDRWSKMGEAERLPYIEQAAGDLARHEREMAAWDEKRNRTSPRSTPRSARKRKGRKQL
jgi:hypothetical protein